MVSLREVSHGIYGAWRLALLDGGAMAWFDRSIGGVLRSFWSAALCYPGFLLLLVMRLDWTGLTGGGFLRLLVIESIGYVIGWTAYPLAALPFCRWVASEERALGFVAAYNWSQLLQTTVLLPVALVTLMQGHPSTAGAYAEGTTYLVLLVYEWFIARIALGAGGLPATALVLLDVVVGAMVSQATQLVSGQGAG